MVFKHQNFPKGGSPPSGHRLKYNSLPSAAWPATIKTGDEKGKIDAFWYLDDTHSQLASAREEVKTQHHVTLGILDNGFSAGHAGAPENLDDSPDGNAVETLDRDSHSSQVKPGSTNGSHGTDAINAAYDRGTAMFAAESDFFSLAFDPIQPRGVLIPASPVYPAGFRRVIGVTGVTADGRSCVRCFASFGLS